MDIGLIGVGAVLGFAATGSSIGTGLAGMATVAAWKKCLLQGKPAPMALLVFVGAPMTQTIYGMIVMNNLLGAIGKMDSGLIMGLGLIGGIGIGVSAWYQGATGAVAADAFSETGKNYGQFVMILGLTETIAILVMVFTLSVIGQFAR
jgi:V/A-type H+/Na+-transporting ATPase subunit K